MIYRDFPSSRVPNVTSNRAVHQSAPFKQRITNTETLKVYMYVRTYLEAYIYSKQSVTDRHSSPGPADLELTHSIHLRKIIALPSPLSSHTSSSHHSLSAHEPASSLPPGRIYISPQYLLLDFTTSAFFAASEFCI